MILNKDSSLPLYQQLADLLREQIRAGVYSAGSRIPSEDELGRNHSISRVTVRKAIDLLVEDGTLIRSHGLGTFVAAPVFVESPNAQGSFAASCFQRGVTPSTRLLSKGLLPAAEEIAEDLGLAAGAPVYELHRLRLANGVASIYEIDYLCAEKHAYLSGAKLENTSLLELIRRETGRAFNGVEDRIDIAFAEEKVAASLECKPGTPLLSVYQKVFAADAGLLYINRQYIRSDLYKYVYSTVRR